jgi:hypothetical protein
MWQWFLLERALTHWRDRLLDPEAYHTIARFRTDLRLPKEFRFSDCIGAESLSAGIVFAQSDTFFYATSSVFYRVYLDMYARSRHLYIKQGASSPQQVHPTAL